jgi:putative glycosyltransferase (TIGR04348 family)
MRGEFTLGASMSSKAAFLSSSHVPRPRVLIVSPALASANNGNWQTASRWARMLGKNCRTHVALAWHGEPCDVLIALHARRSADSVAAFASAHPQRPCIVVLTGTDLYRDIHRDAAAQASLQHASHLVVLQEQGVHELPAALRHKVSVIYQSARVLKPAPVPTRSIRVISVGHLRDEKDPLTYMRAARRLAARRDIHFELIGDALDPALRDALAQTREACPNFRWLGALPHAATRQRIKHSQLLVNTSRMEGGAHVILEAAQSACAVLASRVAGNVGMLGLHHAGYFDLGDDSALARLIERSRDDDAFLQSLREQTTARAYLFEPAEEQRRLRHLITTALESCP